METFLMGMALEEDDGMSLMEQGKLAEARMFYEEKLINVKVEYGNDHPECLNIMEKIAFTALRMGNYLEAKQCFEEVVRKRREIDGECHPNCLRIHMVISFLIMRLGNKSETDLLYEKLKKIHVDLDSNNDNFVLCCYLIAISYMNLFQITEAYMILEELLGKEVKCLWKELPLSLLIKVGIGHSLWMAKKYSEAISYHEDNLKRYSDLSEKVYFLYFLCRKEIASSYFYMSKFSEAKIKLEDILREHTKKISKSSLERLTILSLISKCCIKQGKLGEAKSLLEDVLKNQVEICGKDSFFPLKTSMKIGEILIYLRNFAEAKCVLEELLRKVVMVFGKGNRLYLNVLKVTSTLYMEIGKYGEAAVILEEVLLKQIDVLGKYHPDYLESKDNLAKVYNKSHKYAEALYIFEDMLRIVSSVLGANHEECLKIKMYMAAMYIKMKKFGESAALLEEVLKLQNKILGEDHNDTVYTMGLLAVSKFGLGKRGEGSHALEVFLRKMKLSLFDLDLVTCISQSLKYINEYENSKIVLENIQRAAMDIVGNDHPFILDCQINIAKCLLLLDKPAEAKMLFYKTEEKLSNVYPRNHPACLEAKTAIALAMKDLCEHEKAIILLKEVLKICEENKLNNGKILQTMILIAGSLFELRKYTEMKLMIEEAVMKLSKVDDEEYPHYIKIVQTLASICHTFRDFARTISLCSKLLDIPQNIFGENHPEYLNIVRLLVNSLMSSGKDAEAKRITLIYLK